MNDDNIGAINLTAQLQRSRQFVPWLKASGSQVKFRKETRSILAAGSIQLAMEHHVALVSLAEAGHRASALALTRSVYEAYVWSAWTLRVATDEQLGQLAAGKLTRGLEKMVSDLDKKGFFEQPMLSDMKPVIERMNGFVHGGYEHLRYRVHVDAVCGRYPDDLIVTALRIADLFAVMALLEGPAIESDVELGDRLDAESRILLGLSPPAEAK